MVLWAEAGAGVIATQAMVNMDYGPEGLALLRGGMPAPEVLSRLTGGDEASGIRQAAVLDSGGRLAAHTGRKTIAEAGHILGDGYSVQANMMLNSTVPGAMARAFKDSRAEFPERLLAALNAAQLEGGDIRGMQSAAILIVPVKDRGSARDNLLMDLRVEDNPEPLIELERLMAVKKAYHHVDLGDLAIEKNDLTGAMNEYRKAEELQPDNIELRFWKAVSLLNNRRFDEAEEIFKTVFKCEDRWRELLRRMPAADIIRNDDDILDFLRILVS
jgi:uncharacterized Ntn-hydrolase superfamily protein